MKEITNGSYAHRDDPINGKEKWMIQVRVGKVAEGMLLNKEERSGAHVKSLVLAEWRDHPFHRYREKDEGKFLCLFYQNKKHNWKCQQNFMKTINLRKRVDIL